MFKKQKFWPTSGFCLCCCLLLLFVVVVVVSKKLFFLHKKSVAYSYWITCMRGIDMSIINQPKTPSHPLSHIIFSLSCSLFDNGNAEHRDAFMGKPRGLVVTCEDSLSELWSSAVGSNSNVIKIRMERWMHTQRKKRWKN